MERRAHPRRDQLTEADADRVADVFTTHQRFIEHVARRHAPGEDHVPDIVQSVAIQVCRGLNGFRDESQLTTWLFRVTVNTARSYYRQERRHLRAVEAVTTRPVPEPFVDPDDQVIEAERAAALQDGIDQLKPFYRDVIQNDLKRVRNEFPGSTVELGSKASRHRARRALRRHLADDPRLDP